jgi:CzcA family heavy metal efflux pump
MLNALVRFSLRFRGVILALAFALVGYGVFSILQAKYDVFPDFAPPQVTIQTEAPGLSPEQVELLVTQPIENAINGVPGIQALRSQSPQGLSIILAVFSDQSDVYQARQSISERLASLAGGLPQGVHAPVMTPLTSPTGVVSVFGLTSKQQSLMSVRTVADWTIRQRLLAVPGVALVNVFGGETKEFQIQFEPDQLIRHNLSIEEVLTAARQATAIRGGGFVENANQRIVLNTEGQAGTVDQIAGTVVAHQNGVNITLGDVAHVVEAPEPAFGAASIMGETGVVLVVSSQYHANILEVTRAVDEALRELQPAVEKQGITLHLNLFRPASFIETALANIRSSLLIGAVLVILVLFLFLFNFRVAAISCTAIPLSLLTAVVVLDHMGFSLNTLTLGGLAIALGEVVDDAVIDVENILRRLRENARSEHPRPATDVVLKASIEVRSAVVYATFAVALIFLPVLTLSGVAGKIFAPLGIAYIASILASLLVALTITPALSLIFLRNAPSHGAEPPVVVRWLQRRYHGLLLRVESHHRIVLALTALLTFAGLALVPLLHTEFLPEFREGHFVVHVSAIPGTSIDESLRIGREVTQALTRLPYVRSVAQRVGRSEQADDTWGVHYSEFEVDLKPLEGEAAQAAETEIRKALADIPGVTVSVKTFLAERIEETISGYTASVVVNLYGNDLDQLDHEAAQVAQVVSSIAGARDVQLQAPPGTPQEAVTLRNSDLRRWGLNPVGVLDGVHTAFGGEVVGEVYQGNQVFGVRTILDPKQRRSVDNIADLPLRNDAGIYLTLGQVANVYETSGRFTILHDGARRVQTITANVSGRDVGSFVADARRKIQQKIALPAGSYVEFGGTAEAEAQSRRTLILHSALAGLGILLLLSIVLMNVRNLLLVLVNLPFALVGGVLIVLITSSTLSLGGLIGFVTLFGITLRNSIMMISHYEHLVAEEGMTWGPETALRGAIERLTPILMTATVTGLGLLPLALGSGNSGREIEGPMAIVILGGLITSTALNLLVLPTLALRYGRFEKAEA